MSNKFTFKLFASTAILTATFVGNVHASGGAAAPYDIVIGGAGSCEKALAKVGDTSKSHKGGDEYVYVAKNSQALYPSATHLLIRCHADKVAALVLTIPKGGIGNPEAAGVYSTLAKGYTRIKGGPIPRVGNGFALFTKGSSVIELDAPHMSFEFTLAYYDRGFHDLILQSMKNEKAKLNDQKSAL